MRWFDRWTIKDTNWIKRLVGQQIDITPLMNLLRRCILSVRERVSIFLAVTFKETVGTIERLTANVVTHLRETIVEAIGIVERVGVVIGGQIIQGVSELLGLVERVGATLIELVSRAIGETVGLIENVSATLMLLVQQSVSEILGLTERVTYDLQTAGGQLQWDYSIAYDQNGNQINLNLSPLQDNNTTTSVNIYYTPPQPSNPRRFRVGFNEPRWFWAISIYISGFTPSKSLRVRVWDSYGNYQDFTLNLSQTGWQQIWLEYYEIQNIKEVEFSPDTSVLGFIGLGEIWFDEF